MAVPAVSAGWVRATAGAAKRALAGEPLADVGVSERTASLTKGVVRAMTLQRMKYVALMALAAIGLAGFGLHQWLSASDGSGDRAREVLAAPADKDGAKAGDARPAAPGRRREAVIRLPAGTFVKEVNAAPYGHGRLRKTYEDERILGLVEGSVMGVEFELAYEAEYSLSSNGTIYGLVTNVRVNHLKLLDKGEFAKEFAELKPFIELWPVVEPLVNEALTDLPFSYQFRVQGDRLVINNFRILLAGPNPLGKLGGLAAGGDSELFWVLAYFQALATALEGTFTLDDAKEKPAPDRRRTFPRAGRPAEGQPVR
jgi:hypothetical protein